MTRTNGRERRRAQLEAEHAPNRRRCLIEGCPEFKVWQVTSSREESLASWRAHYMAHHYQPPSAP